MGVLFPDFVGLTSSPTHLSTPKAQKLCSGNADLEMDIGRSVWKEEPFT